MCPTVTIRETYDLSTKQGKMTLIGIHTPSKNIIQRLYPGFCEQYKMFRILHQNVRVASQARLPTGMSGIGQEAGQVSPEDAFNPILYKAVSNQSLTNLEYRIRGLKARTEVSTIDGESVTTSNQNVTGYDDEFDVYYSLLSNTRGWKVAHPMAGFKLSRLRPLVYEKWYNEGVNSIAQIPGTDQVKTDASGPFDGDWQNALSGVVPQSMRGKPHRMPSFNTKYLTGVRDSSQAIDGTAIENGMGNGQPTNAMSQMPEIPTIYTGLILVPPSRTTTLYYRMVVETVVSFFSVQSMDEIALFSQLNYRTAFPVYWNDYRNQSKEHLMSVEENTVSATDGSTISKIMES